MIIDGRCRPPLRYFQEQVMYQNKTRTVANMRSRGFPPSPALESLSMEDFWAEASRAGISRIVIPGRLPNDLFGGNEQPDTLYIELGHDPRVIYLEPISPIDDNPKVAIADAVSRGARGLVFEPGLFPGVYLDDKGNNRFYEAATETRLPVYIMGGGNAGPDVSFANPVALDRVASRYPDLTLVAVHAGWPWIQEVLGVAFRRPNVWLLPDLYFPGMPGEADLVTALSTYLGDRIVFASAYPFCSLEELVRRYQSLPVSPEVLQRVLCTNAEGLFGLLNGSGSSTPEPTRR